MTLLTTINRSAHDTGIEAGSVHCVVTSPPYWGLRAYAGEQGIDWPAVDYAPLAGLPELRIEPMTCALGHEPTPEAYIGHLVLVMREMWRVLRDDGTCWVNLGDSYNGSGGAGGDYGKGGLREGQPKYNGRKVGSLKPKDLVGIPWRFALAAQADGWWLRSDVIWAKPNPMPESVTDRPTKAHEYIFLLAKAQRYYYDAEAIAEPAHYPGDNRALRTDNRKVHEPLSRDKGSRARTGNPTGAFRNRRTVWTIATRPYPGSHYAVFPPTLVEPMILAGTSERGCCPACGAPWERVVEKPDMSERPRRSDEAKTMAIYGEQSGMSSAGQQYQEWRNSNPDVTTGWQPTCTCPAADPVPCTVLDPFAGSGTTGMVAIAHRRRAILCDVSTEYLEQHALERTDGVQMVMV